MSYLPAAANTRTMGALIGATVNELRKRPGSKKHFWCIGHSLGAHVCGNSRLTAKPLLDRITGEMFEELMIFSLYIQGVGANFTMSFITKID